MDPKWPKTTLVRFYLSSDEAETAKIAEMTELAETTELRWLSWDDLSETTELRRLSWDDWAETTQLRRLSWDDWDGWDDWAETIKSRLFRWTLEVFWKRLTLEHFGSDRLKKKSVCSTGILTKVSFLIWPSDIFAFPELVLLKLVGLGWILEVILSLIGYISSPTSHNYKLDTSSSEKSFLACGGECKITPNLAPEKIIRFLDVLHAISKLFCCFAHRVNLILNFQTFYSH